MRLVTRLFTVQIAIEIVERWQQKYRVFTYAKPFLKILSCYAARIKMLVWWSYSDVGKYKVVCSFFSW